VTFAARRIRTCAAALLLAVAASPARSADDPDAMLAHCNVQFEHVPATQRATFGRLNSALRANDGDDGAQGRRIAAIAHDLISSAHAVDAACRATLAHVAALASFVGGDPATAARDERAAIADGFAQHGSTGERSEIYVVFGVYLHATADIPGAIAAERQAIALTGGSRDADAVTSRSEAQLALAGFLGEAAAYNESATTYEAVADDIAASPANRTWGALFAGWMRQALGSDVESARDFDRALTSAPNNTMVQLVLLYRGLSALAADRYGDAESAGQEMQRRLDASSPDADLMRGLADNLLGSVYLAENRVADAASAYDRARSDVAKVRGDQSASALIATQTAEADMYVRLGRYGEARSVLAEAIQHTGTANARLAMVYGGAGPIVAPLYALDATAALALGDVGAARDDIARQLEALRSTPQSLAAAGALAGRAAIERLTGDLTAARRDIDDARALALRLSATRAAPGLDLQSGVIAYYAGDIPTAKRDFTAAFAAAKRLYGGVFGVLGERDRLAFAQLSEPLDDAYLTFAVGNAARDASLGGDAYDLALFRKELVAQTVAALEARVRESRDPTVATTYRSLVAMRRQLATSATVAVASDARRTSVDALTRQTQDLERSLLERFPDLTANASAGARWQDVRAVLRPDEAAVELLHFRQIANRRTDGDAHYAAVVLRPGFAAPVLVDLGSAEAIEGPALLRYRQTAVSPEQRLLPPDRRELERLIWAPLVSALGNARSVYLAADGVLDTVAFDLLADDAGRLLGDTIDLRLVDSTKDLLAPHVPARAAKSALLFGNPAFDLSAAQQQAALRGASPAPTLRINNSTFVALREVTKRAPLPPLPGTGTEIARVDGLLRAHRWTTQHFLGPDALQESLERSAHGQSVVHLATHGAFLPDPGMARLEVPLPAAFMRAPDVQPNTPNSVTPALALPETVIGTPENDPMLRSLLFFAGADRAWARREAPPAGLASGILTAVDAASLDLHGTELVVLSACETGLGAVKSGDGVLGLRRALREAGAQSVLMSLWRMPDIETSELITAFYTHWLGGAEAHAALRAAEREERATVLRRYGKDDAYYWGAFVLVGTPR
jgi:tetratricopeptide (TPR) repeat protein